MYLFRKVVTWSEGFGNVSGASTLSLLYNFSPTTINYLVVLKFFLLQKTSVLQFKAVQRLLL